MHLVPFLLVNQLLFFVVGYGVKTWRGQQYSLALFPLWIRACTTAFGQRLLRPAARLRGDAEDPAGHARRSRGA